MVRAAGRLKAMYFDKTGTLTESQMSLQKIFFSDKGNLSLLPDLTNQSQVKNAQLLLQNFASNHTVLNIGSVKLGDPMEVGLFNFSTAEFTEQEFFKNAFGMIGINIDNDQSEPENLKRFKLLNREVHVLRYLDYSPGLQRMSVIVKDMATNEVHVLSKGAPEKLVQLCKADSLPKNLEKALQEESVAGFRLLAFAYKKLDGKDFEVHFILSRKPKG